MILLGYVCVFRANGKTKKLDVKGKKIHVCSQYTENNLNNTL